MDWPLSFVVDSSKRVVIVTYHAQPTFAQWSQAMERIFSLDGYEPDFGILLDRRALPHGADTEYILRMVNFIDRRRVVAGDSRWAIVVGNSGAFGMGRMAEQLAASAHSIRTFRELADAEAWLALSDTDPRPAPETPSPPAP